MEIIEQVDTARCQAKNHKREHCPFKRQHIENTLREYNSDKNDNIFRPLTGTHSDHQCAELVQYTWSMCCYHRRFWEMQCLLLDLRNLLILRCTSFIQERRTSFTI